MNWRKPVKITDRQKDILKTLAWLHRKPEQCSRGGGFCTPMDVGGQDGSYHSRVLSQLVKKGLAVDTSDGRRWAGSKGYKISETGLSLVEEIREAKT